MVKRRKIKKKTFKRLLLFSQHLLNRIDLIGTGKGVS